MDSEDNQEEKVNEMATETEEGAGANDSLQPETIPEAEESNRSDELADDPLSDSETKPDDTN